MRKCGSSAFLHPLLKLFAARLGCICLTSRCEMQHTERSALTVLTGMIPLLFSTLHPRLIDT